MKDTYRHKGMRKRLINKLRTDGITDEVVLTAMGALPRHFFLDKAFEEQAYQDKAFPIDKNQTISQPYTVAYMTSLLQPHPQETVLEIGTGSGYQAAVLSLLGMRVYTIERQEALYLRAKQLLVEMGFKKVRFFFKDGTHGLPEYAPFSKIIVTAGAPVVPNDLRKQLSINGIMVIPIGESTQKMHRITRISEQEYKEEVLDDFRFVPFLGGVE